jgi:hypothetical protein
VTFLHSIDPGSGKSGALGWALWLGLPCQEPTWQLRDCMLIRGVGGTLDARCAHYLADISLRIGHCLSVHYGDVWVEEMGMNLRRDGSRRKGEKTLEQVIRRMVASANDLLAVQAVGCSLGGALGKLRLAPPMTWKGTAPKETTANRVRVTLSVPELDIVDRELARHKAESLHHNLYDALGIGLHGTGRYRLPGRISRDAA